MDCPCVNAPGWGLSRCRLVFLVAVRTHEAIPLPLDVDSSHKRSPQYECRQRQECPYPQPAASVEHCHSNDRWDGEERYAKKCSARDNEKHDSAQQYDAQCCHHIDNWLVVNNELAPEKYQQDANNDSRRKTRDNERYSAK